MSSGNLIPPNNFITGEFVAPPGTRLPFHQASAPLGWVLDATVSNHVLAVLTGSGGTTHAGTGFTNFTTGAWSADGHALSVGELAIHNHADAGHTHSDAGHQHTAQGGNLYYITGTGAFLNASGATVGNAVSTTNTGNASIQAASANIQNNGGGAAHSHTLSTNWQAANCIICQKS